MTSDFEKDESLEIVLNEPSKRFGDESFKITDYRDADLCGAGIKSKNDKDCLIYISTWNQLPNIYFAEIEKANNKSDLTDYSVIERFENLNIEKLSELVKKYLI